MYKTTGKLKRMEMMNNCNNSDKKKVSKQVKIYDATLREGAQAEGISFSVTDKLKITMLLDELGVDYIEGGWPGSNPKDVEYFQQVKNETLQNARITAFGSTCRVKKLPEEDPSIQSLLEAETPVVTIFGKSWTLHVKDALRTSLGENLRMGDDLHPPGRIEDSRQSSGMILMAVTQDNRFDVCKIDSQDLCIIGQGHPLAGIEEDLLPLYFNEAGKAVLSRQPHGPACRVFA